jgi:hypothetical protein
LAWQLACHGLSVAVLLSGGGLQQRDATPFVVCRSGIAQAGDAVKAATASLRRAAS